MRWLIALAGLASGCFYVDPINERPSAEIVRDGVTLPLRGGATGVHAIYSDPDGDAPTYAWSVAACSAGGATCDEPYLTGTTEALPIPVPVTRADHASSVQALAIHLDVTDSHGAHARPGQDLVLDVQDAAPMVAVQYSGFYPATYPVTLPITVFAMKSDPDDDPSNVTLTWELFPADGSDPIARTWTQLPPDTQHPAVEQYTLVPDVDGLWTVRVTATDGQGMTSHEDVAILVAADRPPCLGTMDPGMVAGTIVVDAARRFSVLAVDDDINIYPAPPSGSILKSAGFHWSLASPVTGGVLAPLGTDAANVVIDPAPYAPGDQLDLRVEISDAVPRTLPCSPDVASCAIDGGTTCFQRQTWHLEIR